MHAIILIRASLRVNNNFFKCKKNIKSIYNILNILGLVAMLDRSLSR